MITRTKAHIDVATIVTNQILASLESKIVPWRRPWRTELPKNLISGKPYRGINLLLLSLSPYASPYYLTYKQVEELGGHVIAGSKGFRIVFWRILEHASPEGELTEIPLMKYYVVFNLEQVSGIPESKLPKTETITFNPIQECEHVINRMEHRPSIINAPQAYYSRSNDTVGIPPRGQFTSPEEYYSTLFHELVHSTGHPDRLDREVKQSLAAMGEDYGREELIAEIGSSFLCAHTHISPSTIQNQASYIANWLKVLGNDKWFVISASAAASKASNYILGLKENNIAETTTWNGDYHNVLFSN
jgi:antirestriction protein ArdC